MAQVVLRTGNLDKVISDHHGVKLQTFRLMDSSNYEVWKESQNTERKTLIKRKTPSSRQLKSSNPERKKRDKRKDVPAHVNISITIK